MKNQVLFPDQGLNKDTATISNQNPSSDSQLANQIREDNKKMVLNLLQKKAPARFSYGWIQEKIGLSEYRLRRILNELQEEKEIDVTGAGRATTYGVPDNEIELW